MAVKFKIGFVIDGETLFGLISKFLPLENLSVEEVVARPHPVAPRLATPQPKLKRRRRTKGIDLENGLNAIILRILSDGEPHALKEVEQAIAATGKFSPNSLGSRITALFNHGMIERASPGHWRATNPARKSA